MFARFLSLFYSIIFPSFFSPVQYLFFNAIFFKNPILRPLKHNNVPQSEFDQLIAHCIIQIVPLSSILPIIEGMVRKKFIYYYFLTENTIQTVPCTFYSITSGGRWCLGLPLVDWSIYLDVVHLIFPFSFSFTITFKNTIIATRTLNCIWSYVCFSQTDCKFVAVKNSIILLFVFLMPCLILTYFTNN